MLSEWSCQANVFKVDSLVHLCVFLGIFMAPSTIIWYFCFLISLHDLFLLCSSSGKTRTSNGSIGLQYHVPRGPGSHPRKQNCYVEVTLGSERSHIEKRFNSHSSSIKNSRNNHITETPAAGKGDHSGSLDQISLHEKTFIYPAEAVVVPVLQTSYARSSLKRFVSILRYLWCRCGCVSLVGLSK